MYLDEICNEIDPHDKTYKLKENNLTFFRVFSSIKGNMKSIIPHYDKVCDAFQKYGVSYAGLFGSRAFGDNKSDSDYDILVEFNPNSRVSLFGMVALQQSLEKLFGTSVDLVTKEDISPYIRESVVSSVIPFYGQKN